MHDDLPGAGRGAADPLRRAPPPGRWAILHGPLAEAWVRLAESGPADGGATWATARDWTDLPELPPGFPRPQQPQQVPQLGHLPPPVPARADGLAPASPGAPPARLVWQGDRRWLVAADRCGAFVSCYVCGV